MEYGPIIAPPPRRPRRPSWAVAILIATLTLLIGGAAGYLIGRASTGPAPTGSSTATPPAAGQTASPSTPALDARAVLSRLKAAGLPMTNTAVQDENTDPNNLLSRPGRYTSRASFDVPGGDAEAERYLIDRGGVIEVFADAAAAKARADYIQAILKGTSVLGSEYDYLAGAVLVRITGSVKPSVAARFEAAVANL